MQGNELALTILAVTLFTAIALGVARLAAGKKLELWRYAVLAVLSIISLIASWLAAQVLVSASVLVGAIMMLASFKWAGGLNWKKSLIATSAWIITWYALNLLVVLVVSAMTRT